jgi:hypothetical protein
VVSDFSRAKFARSQRPEIFSQTFDERTLTMACYRASAACWLKPDDHVHPRRFEPGDEFSYSGTPSVVMIPLDAEARAAKRLTLPPTWPSPASPADTARTALGLGASHNATLAECRKVIEAFLAANPLPTKQKASAA